MGELGIGGEGLGVGSREIREDGYGLSVGSVGLLKVPGISHLGACDQGGSFRQSQRE